MGGRLTLEEAAGRLEGLPLPWSELVGRLLPARVPGFRADDLDRLTAGGLWIWVGMAAQGARDGRVVLVRRDHLSSHLPEPGAQAPASPRHDRLLEVLAARGACFLVELKTEVGGDLGVLLPAIWDLVWAGRITNDTLAPLRALQAGHGRAGAGSARMAGGRWALVRIPPPPSREAQMESRASLLLHRHGLLTRAHAAGDGFDGGFSALYPVLRAMDEVGRARRGWFVAGLDDLQLALPGAVDRLREEREPPGQPDVVALAALDPANPYGSVLPWPASAGADAPRREAGTTVALVDGRAVLLLGRSGRSLWAFDAAEDMAHETLRRAVDALASAHPRRPLHVERVNGVPAERAPIAAVLREAGFYPDRDGLRLDRRY